MCLDIHLTSDVKALNLGKLRLECRLLVFCHCAIHTQTLFYVRVRIAHVGRDMQLALELIVVHVEVGQLDEVAELLGQFTCTKKWNVSKTHKTHV